MQNKKAFTLIELLVVIAIIALLLSIIMPALRKVKEAAKITMCKSNLRQLTIAMRLYAEDNDGKAPSMTAGTSYFAGDYWFYDIAPYLSSDYYARNPEQDRKGGMETMFCPTAKRRPDDGESYWGTATWDWRTTTGTDLDSDAQAEGSYGLNMWLTPEFPDFQDLFPLEQHWPNYSTTRGDVPVFADSNWVGGWPQDWDYTPLEVGWTLDTGIRMHDPGYQMGRFCIDRHNLAICVSFQDGSVKKTPLPGLWKLMWHKGFAPREVEIP
jgi:prepilin-type N-terminal cleavage/methylation domain-containing protein